MICNLKHGILQITEVDISISGATKAQPNNGIVYLKTVEKKLELYISPYVRSLFGYNNISKNCL